MSELRTVVEGDVTVLVKKPNKKDLNEAQAVYNSALRKNLENKAILRQRLNDYLIEQGIWSKEKQTVYDDLVQKISSNELLLKKGGIPLKKAKNIALDLKRLRVQFRDLIAERTAYDNNTAEGNADNSRFDYLVSVCVLDPSTQKPVFKDLDDYNERGTEPWAIKAASELANFIYNLDPNYENNLEENKFLKRFHFTDDQGRFVNKDGHLVSIDENGNERLIDESGRYVAYDENGKQYFVDREGKPYEDPETIVQASFLDDDGNPILEDTNTESTEEVKKPKKKKSDTTE